MNVGTAADGPSIAGAPHPGRESASPSPAAGQRCHDAEPSVALCSRTDTSSVASARSAAGAACPSPALGEVVQPYPRGDHSALAVPWTTRYSPATPLGFPTAPQGPGRSPGTPPRAALLSTSRTPTSYLPDRRIPPSTSRRPTHRREDGALWSFNLAERRVDRLPRVRDNTHRGTSRSRLPARSV